MTNKLDLSIQEISSLDQKYLKKVLDNMRKDSGAKIQFGETGTGYQPHSQITYSNGVVRTVSGLSHKNFDTSEQLNVKHIEFNPDNISREFSFDEIR